VVETPNGGAKLAQPGTSGSSEANRLTAIGHAMFLMARSPIHRHLMITDLEWLVLPPIMLGQFRLWQDNGKPLGFTSWAYLGEEAEDRIVNKGIRRLMPTDWKSGDALWLIDFVAPFGKQEDMAKELRESTHAGKTIKMLQAVSSGRVGIVEW
jgi:cytolysin-activating lysine-acyltransferase